MKTFILSLASFLAVTFFASAQSITVKNGDTTIIYQQSKFKKGQEVQLWYGSGTNKEFEFIQTRNYAALEKDISVGIKIEKLESSDSKSKFIITKVFLTDGGKPFIEGKATWAKGYDKDGTTNDLTILVDLEGAIDNKEIVSPIVIVDNPVKRPRKVNQ